MYRYTKDGQRYWGDGGEYGPPIRVATSNLATACSSPIAPPIPTLVRTAQGLCADPSFDGFDPASGRLTVRNRHDFIDLSGFSFDWALLEDGVEIARGSLAAPQCSPPMARLQ